LGPGLAGLDLHPGRLPEFFPALRVRLQDRLTFHHKELWKVLERRAKVSGLHYDN
jgi:hypothetical protein